MKFGMIPMDKFFELSLSLDGIALMFLTKTAHELPKLYKFELFRMLY